jgi:hypothetical protein
MAPLHDGGFQGHGWWLADGGTGRTVTARPQTTAVLICRKSSSSLLVGAPPNGRRSMPSANPRLQPVARFRMSSMLPNCTPTLRKASRTSTAVTEASSPPTKTRVPLEQRSAIQMERNHCGGPSLRARAKIGPPRGTPRGRGRPPSSDRHRPAWPGESGIPRRAHPRDLRRGPAL